MIDQPQFKQRISDRGRSVTHLRKTETPPKVIQVIRVKDKPSIASQKIVDFKQALQIAKVVYLQDLKQFIYKLDCEPQQIFSLLEKSGESCHMIEKLVPNQVMHTELVKEQNFQLIARLIHAGSQRASCFRIVQALLSQSQIQPAVIQLLAKFQINFKLFLEGLSSKETPECHQSILNLLTFCCDQGFLEQFIGSKAELIQHLVFFVSSDKTSDNRIAVNLMTNLLTEEQHFFSHETYENLVSFLSSQIQTSKAQADSSRLIAVLQLLANSLQMPQLFSEFLNQEGLKQLSNLLENPNPKVKEATLAVYTQIAFTKASDVSIVIESHYIRDLLNLDPSDVFNHPTLKNMLLFLILMMRDKFQNELNQLPSLVPALIILLNEPATKHLWHRALLLIYQLIDFEEWRRSLLQNPQFLKCLVGVIMRGAGSDLFNSLTLFFLGFQNICEVWSVEQVLLLVNELKDALMKTTSQPAVKATIVQVLKRMTCMQNEQIGDYILSIKEICDLILDADFVTRKKGETIQAQMINRMRESVVFKQTSDHTPLYIPSEGQYTRPPVRVELKTKEAQPIKKAISKEAQTQTVALVTKKIEEVKVAPPDLEQFAILKVELQNQNAAYFNLLEENNDLKDRIKFIQADLAASQLQACKPTNTDLIDCVSQVAEQILTEFKQSCQALKTKVAELQTLSNSQVQLIDQQTTKAKLQEALIVQLRSNEGQIENKETQIGDLKKALALAVQRETQLSGKVLQMESKRPLDSIIIQQSVEQEIITDLYQQLMQTRSALLFQEDQLKQTNSKLQLAQIEAKALKGDVPKLETNFVMEVVNFSGNLQDFSEQVNKALHSMQRSQIRQKFQEELCRFYEHRYQDMLDSHEALLLEHLFLKQKTTDFPIDDYVSDLFSLTKKQRIKLSELEGELLTYKKYVVLQPTKVVDAPLKKQDLKMMQAILENQKISETEYLHAALDLVVTHNIHLEFEVLRQNQERLRNENHLWEREFQLKKNLTAGYEAGNWSASGDQQRNISKLVQQMEKVRDNIKGHMQKDFSGTIAKQVKTVRMITSQAREVKLEIKVKKAAAGAHGVMEVSAGDGKKPRFVNDYEAPIRPSILNQYFDQIESALDIMHSAIQDQQKSCGDEEGLLKFQALIDEVDLLKSGLETRGQEFQKLGLAWTRVLYEKCDIQNSLTLALKGKKGDQSSLKDQVSACLKNEIELKEEIRKVKQKLMFGEQERAGLRAQVKIMKFGKQEAAAIQPQSKVEEKETNFASIIVPQNLPMKIAEPKQYKKEKVLQLLRTCLADGNAVTETLIDFIFTKVTSQDESNQVLVKKLRALQASQQLISEFSGVSSIEEAVRMKLRAIMAPQAEENQDLVARYLATITELLQTKFKDDSAVKKHIDCLDLMMQIILRPQFANIQDDGELDMLLFEKTQLEERVRALEGKVIPSLQSTISGQLDQNKAKATTITEQSTEPTATLLELVQLRLQKKEAQMTIETLQTQTKQDQTTIYELQQIILQQSHPVVSQTIQAAAEPMEGDLVQFLRQVNSTLSAEIQSLRQDAIRKPLVDKKRIKEDRSEDLRSELSQALTKIELMKVQHSQVFQQIQVDDLFAENLKIYLENSFGTNGRFELAKLISYINKLSSQMQSQAVTIAQLQSTRSTQEIQLSSTSDLLQKTDFECKMLHDKYITTLDQLQQLDFMYQELNDEHISLNQAIQMYQASFFAISQQENVIQAVIDATKPLMLTCIDVRKQRDMYRSKSVLASQEAHKQKLKYKHSKQTVIQFRKELLQIQQVKHAQPLEQITQSDLVLEVAALRAEIQVQKTYNSKALVTHIQNQNLNHLHRMLAAESNAAALLIELNILRSQNINLYAQRLLTLTNGGELAEGLIANQVDKLMLENDLLKEKIKDLTQQVQTMSMERELYSVNFNQMQVDALETKLRCQQLAWSKVREASANLSLMGNPDKLNQKMLSYVASLQSEPDPKTRFETEQMSLRIRELENQNRELLVQCSDLTMTSENNDLNKSGLQVMQLILQSQDREHLLNRILNLETELISANSKQDIQNNHTSLLSERVQNLEANEIRLLSDLQAMSLRLLLAVSGEQQISQQLTYDNLQHQVALLQQRLQALDRNNKLLSVKAKSNETVIAKFKQHHQMLIQSLEKAREDLILLRSRRVGKETSEVAEFRKSLQVQKDFYIAQNSRIMDLEQKLAVQAHQNNPVQTFDKPRQDLRLDFEVRLKHETATVVELMRKNNLLVDQVLALREIEAKYDLEVKAHHKLNTQITVLEKQLTDIQKPSDYLGLSQSQKDLHFYDLLGERFLTQLSLYQDEIRFLKRSGQQKCLANKLESKLQKALDRIEFMWLRLDFQSRVDHLLETNELSQALEAYKQEITKVRSDFKRFIQDQDLNQELAEQVSLLKRQVSRQDAKANRLKTYQELKHVFHPGKESKGEAINQDAEYRELMVIGFVRSNGVVLSEGDKVGQMERRLISAEDENIKLKSYISELTLKIELFSAIRQQSNQPRRQLKTVTPNMIGEMPIRQLKSRQIQDGQQDRMLQTGMNQSFEDSRLTLPELDARHLSSALSKQRNQNSTLSQRGEQKKSVAVKFR